ncbi:hypothetical protein ABZP36_004720 [Zizania latifolia]
MLGSPSRPTLKHDKAQDHLEPSGLPFPCAPPPLPSPPAVSLAPRKKTHRFAFPSSKKTTASLLSRPSPRFPRSTAINLLLLLLLQIAFSSLKMEPSKTQPEGSVPSVPKNPAMASCRKKKSDDATFLEDLKDHIDEFIHASMDEHKTCFKNTIQKMFGMSKAVAQRSAEVKEAEVESALPLQTSVSQ